MCQRTKSDQAAGGYLGYPQNFHENYVAGWRLGKGNCGAVYTAIRRADGKKLAVKCISKVSEDEEASEKLASDYLRLVQSEIEILKSLKGLPTILQIEDIYEDESKIYLVTELCKGGPLSQKRSVYKERDVIRYIRSALQAAVFCHANGVIHRDFKPENFLLTSKDKRAELKLIDFGIAARYSPESLPVDDLGHPCGTIFFMAPEITRAKWWPVSDVWAVGIMAAHMLTGVYPFNDPESPDDPDPSRTSRIIRTKELDQTGPEWSKISPTAVDFVRHLLVKDPSHRPTAQEALSHPFLAQGESGTSSLSSSVLSTPNMSFDPMRDELPYPFTDAVEAGTLAQRLKKFSFVSASSTSLSSMVSSQNISLDPMKSDELPYLPPTPAAVEERVSLMQKIRKFTKFGSKKTLKT